MFGKICFLAIALIASSCAKPNYASPGRGGVEFQQGNVGSGVFAVSGKKIWFAWERQPTDSDFGSFYFRTSSADPRDGFPILEDLPVSVLLWMPGMGHGSTPVTVEHVGVGTYRASKVFFTMRGDWQIRFQMKDGATVKDEAVLDYTF